MIYATADMDLYLLSPVFLKKMIRRPSATAGDLPGDGQDTAAPENALRLLSRRYDEGDLEAEELDAIAWRRRRRSSLDRMLRQHAYIIICVLCYTCNLLGYRT